MKDEEIEYEEGEFDGVECHKIRERLGVRRICDIADYDHDKCSDCRNWRIVYVSKE